MEEQDLPAKAAHIGEVVESVLGPLVDEVPAVAEVRGRGAMIGVEFVKPGTMEPNKELVGRIAKRTIQEGLIMLTCGMYDGSGEFASPCGNPLKSGVGGGLLSVVDGKMGIGIYGPSLDAKGNSIAGRKILQFLSSQMKLHIFAKKD